MQKIPEEQLEHLALQLDAKDFTCRSKAKTKPQRRDPWLFTKNRPHGKKELDWYRTWETFSPRERGFEGSGSSSSSFTTDAPRRRRSCSLLENEGTSSESIPTILFIGLTIDGKHVWWQEEESNRDSVLYWWIRSNCLFPSSSRTFRTQSYWPFITGQCCDSDQILEDYVLHWKCV